MHRYLSANALTARIQRQARVRADGMAHRSQVSAPPARARFIA